MQRPDDTPALRDLDDTPPDDASAFMEQLSGAVSDYELLDREWAAGAGL